LDYIDILQEMLRYIDANIKEKLSVEKLAARAGFSPYHFCRVFQWEIGYSIMEYVRNRRLAFAASEFNSGRRITDIAIDYGFETYSGFTRAFRRYFSCSPEVYRMHASYDVPKLPVLEKIKQYVSGGIVMEPKMVKKEAVKIAGFALKTTVNGGQNKTEIPKFWMEYLSDGRCKKLHGENFVKSHTEFGACFPENPENGEFVYVIGVEVKDGCEIPGDYHVCVIPEALYAVFSSPPTDEANFSKEIQGTWKYIYSEWFPNSGYEFANGKVDLELYDKNNMGEKGNICDIYIPVVKKAR
jgi:AraC family transcriptional regulator